MANRKQRRTSENKVNYNHVAPSEQTNNAIKTLIAIVVVFGIFYLVTVLVTSNLKSSYSNNDDDNVVTEIQYEKILAGETFSMPDTEYLVFFYDSKADEASLYSAIVSSYKEKDTALPIYIVDLSNGFNTSVINSASNHKAKSSSELKIKGPTLIKIKNKLNVKYIEGLTNIQAYL